MTSATLARRDLLISLFIVSAIVAMALLRLAWQDNWQKVMRVSLAFVTYSALLMTFVRHFAHLRQPPFWIFAVAAALAELASSWLRPDWRTSDMFTMPVVAALIGGVHWLSLRSWRPLRRRIVFGEAYGENNNSSG
jgi:hypothetical protein